MAAVAGSCDATGGRPGSGSALHATGIEARLSIIQGTRAGDQASGPLRPDTAVRRGPARPAPARLVAHLQLGADPTDIGVHRRLGYPHPPCGLLVREPPADVRERLLLALRQRRPGRDPAVVATGAFQQVGRARWEIHPAGGHAAQRGDVRVGVGVLAQIATRAGLQGGQHVGGFPGRRHDDDRHLRRQRPQGVQRRGLAERVRIAEHDVDLAGVPPEQRRHVGHLGHDGEALRIRQHRHQPTPRHQVIVDDRYLHHHRLLRYISLVKTVPAPGPQNIIHPLYP
jgi:hypothetical protein